MSLLSEAMTACTMLTLTVESDGYGGTVQTWTDGAGFEAAIVFDQSVEAQQAEAAGVSSRYTVTTSRSTVLKFHEIFRRESDGKVFRVTSDGDDSFTPYSTALDMRQVTAEEWEKPKGEEANGNEQV